MKEGRHSNNKISTSFYQQDDVVLLSKALLGKLLCTYIDGRLTKSKIVETEAYSYLEKGCHAYSNKRTKRTAPMFQNGGIAYVYLCYGVHSLFNIVTNIEGVAEAVLIRAVEPVEGTDIMLQRRNVSKANHLGSGPGKLTKALGISLEHNEIDLAGDVVWLEEDEIVKKEDIVVTRRVGIDYAGEDALLPWRFYIKDNKHISKK